MPAPNTSRIDPNAPVETIVNTALAMARELDAAEAYIEALRTETAHIHARCTVALGMLVDVRTWLGDCPLAPTPSGDLIRLTPEMVEDRIAEHLVKSAG